MSDTLVAPRIEDLFDPAVVPNRAERLAMYEDFKSAMADTILDSAHAFMRGEVGFSKTEGIVKYDSPSRRVGNLRGDISKVDDPERRAELEKAISIIEKDLTQTSPINSVPFASSGIVPFDVAGPLAMLIPRNFTLRNMVARTKGIGQSTMFQQITGITNSGTGGVASAMPFFDTGVTDSFGGVTLNRPPKINYAGSRVTVPYGQMGFSTEVDYTAQFAGQDYVDLRLTAHQSLIWSHMLGEERALGNSRNFALAVPGGTWTPQVDASYTATGLPAGAGTVIVTAISSMGESQGKAGSAGVTTTLNESISWSAVGTLDADTLGLAVYYTNTGTGYHYRGTTPDISGASGPAKFVQVAALPSTSVDNGSYSAKVGAWNGFVTTLNNASFSGTNPPLGGGYQKALNGFLSTTEPGGEVQDLFASLWESVQARPDQCLTTGQIRRGLAKSLQDGNNGYRLNISAGDGVNVGSAVNGIENESAGGAGDDGGMVALKAWPYMPDGVLLVHSTMFPFPDAGFANTVEVRNCVDLTLIEWTQIGLTWDSSSYQYGAQLFRSPGWSGAVTNILTTPFAS